MHIRIIFIGHTIPESGAPLLGLAKSIYYSIAWRDLAELACFSLNLRTVNFVLYKATSLLVDM